MTVSLSEGVRTVDCTTLSVERFLREFNGDQERSNGPQRTIGPAHQMTYLKLEPPLSSLTFSAHLFQNQKALAVFQLQVFSF